jgi:CubicO group peptidase (beta-lactamase class C family)
MAVAVVAEDRTLLVVGLGRRNLDENLPVTSETLFYIASTTKPFVALATRLLEENGSLELNRPVRTYLPQFALNDPTETRTITLRDLLAHRRGLQDHPITFGEAFTGQMTEDRFYRLLRQVRAAGELDYQNLHYTLLGRVIEAAAEVSWKEYVGREVLYPAGLARTGARSGPLTDDPNAAVPYERTEGGFHTVRLKTDRTMHAAGGMLSTADDLAGWVRMHLNDGRIDGRSVFPAAAIREMREPQIYEEDENPFLDGHRRIGWGLGWDIREDRGARLIYHDGVYRGWAAHTSFMPEIGIGVVVLANTSYAGLLAAYVIAADVYDRVRGLEPREVLPRAMAFLQMLNSQSSKVSPKAEGGPSLPLERYVGSYVNEDWGTLDVSSDGVELRARMGDLPLPLVWIGADTLIADEDHEVRFAINATGQVMSISVSALAADSVVRFIRQ